MRKLALRLVVALSTFAVGIGAASLWFISNRSKVGREQSIFVIAPVSIKPTRKYQSGMAGEAETRDGHKASFRDFSLDGMDFYQWSEYYDSPERANRELEKKVGKAIEIIKREPMLNSSGRAVGVKVIATFPSKEQNNSPVSLLFTDGSKFSSVRSSSLANILELDKDFNQ